MDAEPGAVATAVADGAVDATLGSGAAGLHESTKNETATVVYAAFMGRRGVSSLLCVASMAVVACHRNSAPPDSASDGGATSTKAGGAPEVARCKADGLGAAKLVTTWKPPESCHWKGLAHGATTIMRSEADLVAGALDCPESSSSGIDFTKDNVVVTGRALSPATVGVDVYDDGQKVTFVSRQRDACPNEYPPMPITVPIAFLVPAGATRTFGEAMCKQPWKCP